MRFTTAADLLIAMETLHRQGRMKEALHRTVAAPKAPVGRRKGLQPNACLFKFFPSCAQGQIAGDDNDIRFTPLDCSPQFRGEALWHAAEMEIRGKRYFQCF